jgi:N-acetylglucosamine kinase-like BadF-type ATPase
MAYFLGIDGGQSHTTALIADARGRILGKGHAGASNHTRAPGGRERLTQAVTQAVNEALQHAGLHKRQALSRFRFASAHLALTGEPQDKIEIVCELLDAERLVVGHDAPGALAGAHAGGAGVIVLAGTGSVACGETWDAAGERRFVRIGGRGYLFGDEGSGFAIARDALRAALRRADREAEPDQLQRALLKHFHRTSPAAIAEDVYAGTLSREALAGFTARVAALAARGNQTARALLTQAAAELAELAAVTLQRLGARELLPVSYGGGVFRSPFLCNQFVARLERCVPGVAVVPPRFGPDIGALLLAYRQAGRPLTPRLLANLTTSQDLLR